MPSSFIARLGVLCDIVSWPYQRRRCLLRFVLQLEFLELSSKRCISDGVRFPSSRGCRLAFISSAKSVWQEQDFWTACDASLTASDSLRLGAAGLLLSRQLTQSGRSKSSGQLAMRKMAAVASYRSLPCLIFEAVRLPCSPNSHVWKSRQSTLGWPHSNSSRMATSSPQAYRRTVTGLRMPCSTDKRGH